MQSPFLSTPFSARLRPSRGRCTTLVAMMPEGDTKPKPRLEQNARSEAKAEADNQTITEVTKNSTVNAEDDMTHDSTSSHKVKEQGGMLVIAGSLSNSVPKAYDSVPFE